MLSYKFNLIEIYIALGSQIPNLSLVLALFFRFANDWRESRRLNRDGGKYPVVAKADRLGLTIAGCSVTDKLVDEIQEDIKTKSRAMQLQTSK